MSIFCNESTHLSNKPECQQKSLNWSISFIPGPFVGYQHPGDLLIRVLSWSLFSERGAGELSAGSTRICSRANKNNSIKGGRIQGGVEAEVSLEGPLYPEWPYVSGIFFMTSSWVGSPTMAPGNLHAWLHGTYTVIYMLGYMVHTLWFTRCIHLNEKVWGHSMSLFLRGQEGRFQEAEVVWRAVSLSRVWPLSVSVCFLCLVFSCRLPSLAERLLFIIPFFSVRYWKW